MDTDGAVGRAGEVTGCCCGAEAVDRNICKREGFVAVYLCVSVLDGLRGCVCVCVCACEWRCPRDDAGIASALWWSQAARVPRGGGARWEHGGGARDEGVGAARDEGVQRFECERARVRARRRSSGVSQQHGGCEGSCCIAHYACTACMIWLLMYETQRTAATPGHGMEQAKLLNHGCGCVREMVVGRMNEPQPNTATPRGTTQQIGGGVRSRLYFKG